MPIVEILPSFNAGELSPRLWSRVDLEKYASGARTLENFIVMPYGGINRRPGSQYMGAAKYANRKCRLLAFNFSTTTNFILELGHQYLRFWSNGQQVMSGMSPYEISTVFNEADLFDIQFCQINDVCYLTHPNYPVQKLSRISDTNWTIAEPSWEWPPFRDENSSNTFTITPSATTGSGITLTASSALFNANHVGSYWQIGHARDTANVSLKFSSNNNQVSSPLRVIGKWSLLTTQTWTGTVLVQRSTDGTNNWETVRSYTGNGDRNITDTGTELTEGYYRLNVTLTAGGGNNPVFYLETLQSVVYGYVQVTGYTDSTHVTATVIHPLQATSATVHWSEGAWSAYRGYPRTCALHQQRLCFGGNAAQGQTVWMSASGDLENFNITTETADDSPFIFSLATVENFIIQWLASYRQDLIIGTSGDEFVLKPAATSAAITPTSFDITRQSSYGSAYLNPILVNNALLYTQRNRRKILEASYNWQIDGFVSQDLTLLSDHVTHGGIIQTAFQQQLDAIVWCVTGDGILAAMTYDRNQNVVSWHRHTTQGTFESVARIFGTSADEIWTVVNRTINGSTVRYIERFDPAYRDSLENKVKSAWYYADAYKTQTFGSPTTAVTGLSHLEGATVTVLADGAVVADKVVSGGAITLPKAATTVTVGLSYTSTLIAMPLDSPLRDGTAQGRKYKLFRLSARFYNSIGAEVLTDYDNDQWDVFPFRDTADAMDTSPPVFNGTKDIFVSSPYSTTCNAGIRQRQPLPQTILALIPKWEVSGD